MKRAFVGDHIEPVTDFDFDEIDRRLAADINESKLSAQMKQVEIVSAAKLLHHIVVIGAINPVETMKWVNVFLYIMGLHPNQNHSGELIADGLKMSKEEFFRRTSKMRRILKARGLFIPRVSGEWRSVSRTSIANSAIQRWQKRGGKPQMRIGEAEKKLNWIADYVDKLEFKQLTPLARKELKAKLLPIARIMQQL